jgi:hypothetical protein
MAMVRSRKRAHKSAVYSGRGGQLIIVVLVAVVITLFYLLLRP